ncbi:GNAT family N-acetyltransferase [Halobacteriales archaeon QS_4_69_34]|nr:MAG: GNAT family N-acetyltransferase [Halobacteriales archaeon QS_4_69_34]
MKYAVLGWSAEGPTLRLDHRTFAYAGKFVTSATGTAVVLADGAPREQPDAREGYAEGVLAAVAFDADRTDPRTLVLRYITVRADRRGDGIGPRLATFTVERAAARGYERARIAVNNPFAYEALSKAGFAFTGEETGLAELVLERPVEKPGERSRGQYQEGLDVFRERDLTGREKRFLAARADAAPPAVVEPPE